MALNHISNDLSGRILKSLPNKNTTDISTHVSNKDLMSIRNPLGQILQKERGGTHRGRGKRHCHLSLRF